MEAGVLALFMQEQATESYVIKLGHRSNRIWRWMREMDGKSWTHFNGRKFESRHLVDNLARHGRQQYEDSQWFSVMI